MIAPLEGIEVQIRACADVGRVDIHKYVGVVGILLNDCSAVEVGHFDPVGKGPEGGEAFRESFAVEARVNFVSAVLGLAADDPSIEDARAVGAVQKEECEGQVETVRCTGTVDLPLVVPLRK